MPSTTAASAMVIVSRGGGRSQVTGPTLRRLTCSSSHSMTATASMSASECSFNQSNWVTVMQPTVSAPGSSGSSRSVSSDTSPVLCARGQSGGFPLGCEDLTHGGGSSPIPFLDGVGVYPEGERGIGMAEKVSDGPDVHACMDEPGCREVPEVVETYVGCSDGVGDPDEERRHVVRPEGRRRLDVRREDEGAVSERSFSLGDPVLDALFGVQRGGRC